MKVRWTVAAIAGPIAQEYDDKHLRFVEARIHALLNRAIRLALRFQSGARAFRERVCFG